MKYIITAVLIALVVAMIHRCNENKITEKDFAINIDMRIAAMNYDCSLTNDKFRTAQLCNTILFETIKGEKLYREINTCQMRGLYDITIDSKWIYQHSVGDTVHFHHLKKSEFFKINK